MEVGWIFLNCLMTVLQMYIYLSIGILAYYKKIFTKQTSALLSKIVAFFIYPFYNMLELARIATPANMQIFWILLLSTVVSISIGLGISILSSKVLKIDVRIAHSFSLFVSLPSLGSLPLILGRALCITGGPLDGDPRCSVIIGFMVTDQMIFQIQMFFIGYYIVMKDVDLFIPFEEKLHYLWHLYLYKKGKNDLVVLDLFERYLKDKKQVKTKYIKFMRENKIMHLKGIEFQFNLTDKENHVALVENPHIYKKPSWTDIEFIEDNDCHILDYTAIEIHPEHLIFERNLDKNGKMKTHHLADIIHTYIKHTCIKINKYYDNLFKYIEEDLDTTVSTLYQKEKQKILHNLEHFPPKFPIVRSLPVSKKTVELINQDFITFEIAVKPINPKFKLTPYSKKHKLTIFGRVYYPPIIACFVGLLIGLSGMREILFSQSHYLQNLVNAWSLITVINVSLIEATAGITIAATNKISRNMILSKKEILIGILIRFVIMPGFGLLWIYLWVSYYKGVIVESKVIRFAMFIPFCSPVSCTSLVFLNLVNIYVEEAGFQIFIQYMVSIVLLSTNFLVYFVTLGS
jgi:hypothetical protein